MTFSHWLRLVSTSMSPLIPADTFILVRYITNEPIKISDIVVFLADNKLIAHRILAVTPQQVFQAGDATLIASHINRDQILGIVEKIQRNNQEIDLYSRRGRWLNQLIAYLSLRILQLHSRAPKLANLLHRLKYRLIHLLIFFLF